MLCNCFELLVVVCLEEGLVGELYLGVSLLCDFKLLELFVFLDPLIKISYLVIHVDLNLLSNSSLL